MTSKVKNNYAYVIMQDICNKFIEVNFCVGCMVSPFSQPNRLLQRSTTMSLINKMLICKEWFDWILYLLHFKLIVKKYVKEIHTGAFASFQSGEFITDILVNPLDRKLQNYASVYKM